MTRRPHYFCVSLLSPNALSSYFRVIFESICKRLGGDVFHDRFALFEIATIIAILLWLYTKGG